MTTALYETDFYAWTQRQSELLLLEEFTEVDWQHIAEEIRSLGNRDKRQVKNRLIVLMMHLLKSQYQPERSTPSWRKTMLEQRQRLHFVLEDSPSLRAQLNEFIALAYPYAVKHAVLETGLSLKTFPLTCPYTAAQLLDETFLPPQA